jgi:putative methylase
MGRTMQKRLARKIDLEKLLSGIRPHPTPSPSLEQYTIPVNLAAQMLYLAAYTYGDIVDKTVLDLGCGTGRLVLGAAFLGAREVVGVDIDKTAVKVASENARTKGLEHRVQWIVSSMDGFHGQFDTVLQNPPFGVQKRGADRRFLQKALESGRVTYSLHKSVQHNVSREKKMKKSKLPPSSFLRGFIQKNGGTVKAVHPMVMTVPHMFDFHTRKKHEFGVDLYVIERR